VNEGDDEGWSNTSDAGLMPIEQLLMQIATSDARVTPTMSLMHGEFMRQERGLLLTEAPGEHLL